ncbi:Hsp20/alpha crystallin family protein [Streptomyces decoyicus]|uniref:Hsp20/alpha crystallin family protein n=1 Tax=Streptomyces decoyicus TaxID=249567 RepID=UPI0033BD58F0
MERQAYRTRNPLAEFDELINQMGGLIESTVGGVPSTAMPTWIPLADVTETDDSYQVDVELPGMKSKDIDVEVSGQELVISGEIKERERKGILRRGTRRTGRFEYRMLLPGEVNTEGVKAQVSDGVLTVTVPKTEVAKPRHIEITENKSGR